MYFELRDGCDSSECSADSGLFAQRCLDGNSVSMDSKRRKVKKIISRSLKMTRLRMKEGNEDTGGTELDPEAAAVDNKRLRMTKTILKRLKMTRLKMMEEFERTQLDPELWQTLPQEMLESVIARLPFAKVVAFRRLCKKWYSDLALLLISKPLADLPFSILIIVERSYRVLFGGCKVVMPRVVGVALSRSFIQNRSLQQELTSMSSMSNS